MVAHCETFVCWYWNILQQTTGVQQLRSSDEGSEDVSMEGIDSLSIVKRRLYCERRGDGDIVGTTVDLKL